MRWKTDTSMKEDAFMSLWKKVEFFMSVNIFFSTFICPDSLKKYAWEHGIADFAKLILTEKKFGLLPSNCHLYVSVCKSKIYLSYNF